jgi:hypothetical protein
MAKFEITWLEDLSDESVLEEIRRVAALVPDIRLTKRMFDSKARIKSMAVAQRFGSWSEAVRRAGLSDALPIYTDDAIVSDIRRVFALSDEDGFTLEAYKAHGQYSVSVIRRRFGGWREALNRASLGDRYVGPAITEGMKSQTGRAMTEDEILRRIRDIAEQLGKPRLSGAEIEANSEITQSQMYRRFGSVSAALRRAGVEQVGRGRRYTEDEIFENLLSVWTHYGRAPTVAEMDSLPSTVGKNAYLHRYGGWRKALKAFIERTNSEADHDPAQDSEQTLPVLADSGDRLVRPAGDPDATERPQPISQIGTSRRGKKRGEPRTRPEDRRKPSLGLRSKVMERDQSRCQICGRGPPTEDRDCRLHVDHIMPFAKGGKTTFENLRVLCSDCNWGRGARYDD